MDEKTFSTDKDGYHVWRTDNTRYEPKNILSMSSGHVTAAFCGWMSDDNPGDLVEVERNLNVDQYVNILGIMLPNVRKCYCEKDNPRIVVVEDNSTIHIARIHITRAWYENHSKIVRLNLASKISRPQLNVIENLWAEMVREWTFHVVHRREDFVQRMHLA